MNIKIGITGSIGMGKTTISSVFKKNNIPVWDADVEVHKLYKKGTKSYETITTIYPELCDKKEINRQKIVEYIKQKKVDLKVIEKTIQPFLKESRFKFIEENSEEKFIIFDIPLLFETGADVWLDYVISVYCSEKTQRERLIRRKNFDLKKINYLLKKQLSTKEKNKKSDFIINTDLEIKVVEKKIETIINHLDKENG